MRISRLELRADACLRSRVVIKSAIKNCGALHLGLKKLRRREGFLELTAEPLDPKYGAVLAQAIVDTVRDPLLVLDRDFRVTAASRFFLNVFEVLPEDVIGRSVYEILHGCFKIARLVSLLNKILPEHAATEDFEIDAVFTHLGRRALIVNAREVFFVGNTHKAILLSFADETHRRLIEKEKEFLLKETRKQPAPCIVQFGEHSRPEGDVATGAFSCRSDRGQAPTHDDRSGSDFA